MEAVTCRVLPYAVADGPMNMAADEVLLHSALTAGPALRCYGWEPATLSLGYFQPAGVRLRDPRLATLPWVRRPSGGATLVHHHELTYCLAVPPALLGGEPWMPRMHRIVMRVLAALGGVVEAVGGEKQVHGDVLCFQQYTPGDLLCRGKKIGGSAQRKHHQALMQHGSILLAQSEYTPELPGIRELTGVAIAPADLEAALYWAFEELTGWRLWQADWSVAEREAVAALVREKYAAQAWNERR